MVTRTTPVKVNVVGFIYDGDCNPVEGAALTFKSSKNFFRDGNHYNIDEDLVTDANGYFSIPLYATKDGDQALATVRVTVEYTNTEGNEVFDSFDILVDPEMVDDAGEVRIQDLLVEAGSTTIFSGPRGPRGIAGERGLIGREVYDIARQDGAEDDTGTAIPGRERIAIRSRWNTLAPASAIRRTPDDTDDLELLVGTPKKLDEGTPQERTVYEFFELRVFYDEWAALSDDKDVDPDEGSRLSLEIQNSNEIYLGRDDDNGDILIASKTNLGDNATVILRGIIYGRGIKGDKGDKGDRGTPGDRGEPGTPGRDGSDAVALLLNGHSVLTIGRDGANLGYIRGTMGAIAPDIGTIYSLLITEPLAGRAGLQVAVAPDLASRTWLANQSLIWINDSQYELGDIVEVANPYRTVLNSQGNPLALPDAAFGEGDEVRLVFETADGVLSPSGASFSPVGNYIDEEFRSDRANIKEINEYLVGDPNGDLTPPASGDVNSRLETLEGMDTEDVLEAIRDVDDTESLNDLDKLVVIQPLEEGRPAVSDLVNFSRLTEVGVVIDQSNSNPDFVQRDYDDTVGVGNPNHTVFLLATEGIVNAYSPQMQMEEVDAGADLPDTPRRTLVLTNQNGERLQGALLIDPVEGKLILLLSVGEYALTIHYGRSGTREADYRAIPAAGGGRVPIGFLKLRGQSGYTEVGGYVFDILAAEIGALFPNTGTVNGMRLRITALQSLVGGEYTGHLNLFLGNLTFTSVVVGEEVKALPYDDLEKRVDEKIDSRVSAVEHRLQDEIDSLPSGDATNTAIANNAAAIATNAANIATNTAAIAALPTGGGGGGGFEILLLTPNSLLAIPGITQPFTVTAFVKNAAQAPAGVWSATIDGIPVTISQPALQSDTTSVSFEVRIAAVDNAASEIARGNIVRSALDGGLNIQVTKGTGSTRVPSAILHVTINTPDRSRSEKMGRYRTPDDATDDATGILPFTYSFGGADPANQRRYTLTMGPSESRTYRLDSNALAIPQGFVNGSFGTGRYPANHPTRAGQNYIRVGDITLSSVTTPLVRNFTLLPGQTLELRNDSTGSAQRTRDPQDINVQVTWVITERVRGVRTVVETLYDALYVAEISAPDRRVADGRAAAGSIALVFAENWQVDYLTSGSQGNLLGYLTLPQYANRISRNFLETMWTLTGLTVGKLYEVSLDFTVVSQGANDTAEIIFATIGAEQGDTRAQADARLKVAAVKYAVVSLPMIPNSSGRAYTVAFIAKATTLVVTVLGGTGNVNAFSVVINGIAIESAQVPRQLFGNRFS